MTTRALVLGGGGSLGNAWEIGVLAGLADGGVDPTRAELVVGTSAGATAAAMIACEAQDVLLAQVLAEAYPAPRKPPAAGGAPRPGTNFMQLTADIMATSADPVDMRRRIGAAALELESDLGVEIVERRLAQVASRLPSQDWPDRRIVLTAVDAETGEEVLLDRDSGVALADAVAASTAVGFGVPPHAIGKQRLLDGGYRANENADLASGYDRVLVLSPFGGRSRHPQEWGTALADQVALLKAQGSAVETIFPDDASREAFGPNMMDLSRRPAAAQAGFDQGKARAGALEAFWR
ncbi:patatin-like phospholipase family protein [Demequina salsinemoris]|uniref:patatin-like phospholipase family protein n=1 Tax=Demequina salsinemoris TaxID=577470 RepID=UPI000AAF2AB4|nr:patatin-like phospholipase family protein [Demequina salsinemoris]